MELSLARRSVVKSNNKLFVIILNLLAALFFSAPLRAEPALTSYQPLAQEVFSPVWALEKHELTPMAVASLVVGDKTVGVIAVYDDPATDRPTDYLELYDDTGRLLALGWFDRFGIERVAADRGFVEGKNDLEGVFVILLAGDSV
jgi:hypothetical protein